METRFALTLMGQPLSHIKGRGFLSHCLCVYGFVPAEATQPQGIDNNDARLPGWGRHPQGRLNVLGMRGKALFISGELDCQAGDQGFRAHLAGVGVGPCGEDCSTLQKRLQRVTALERI